MVKPEKYFFAPVHAESSLCGGPRVKWDVGGLAHRTMRMASWLKSGGLANAASVEVEGSVVVRWAILQTSATQSAAEGIDAGGTQALSGAGLMPALMEAGLENSQPVRWIVVRLRAVSPALRGHRIEVRDYLTQRRSQIDRTRAVIDRTRAIAQQ